jgi:mono/diheme cytochrome c family protein
VAFVAAAVVFVSSGCIQEMSDQPRYDPLEPSSAFDNGMSSRPPVQGTVPRGELQLDEPYFSGKADGQFVSELPEAALAGRTLGDLVTRGQQRYAIFCSHCHGQVGGGTGGDPIYVPLVGMVVARGFPTPPTYHQDRLRQAPIGHFFDVITNGAGRMPPHGYLVPPEDRWAIATYIRTLQVSQFALRDELSAEDLAKLNAQPAPAM